MKKYSLAKKIMPIFVVVSNVMYLMWRIVYTIPYDQELWVIFFAWALLLSEVISFYTALVLFMTRSKHVKTTVPETVNTQCPEVDVFIATHNEDVELLFKTVNGCKHMEYPNPSKVHIHICDDNNRIEVKQLAEKMGVNYLGVYRNKHAKSGNYNYALNNTNAPLIVTFDADMIPHSNFLMKTIPYFISNEYDFNHVLPSGSVRPFNNIGFIQTPQNFYNPDLFHYNLHVESHIPNEQDFFTREVNVANNSFNAAVYTGSNTVISRQAIVDAGGFPTNTITEDFQLGVQIQSLAYQCLATTEVLAGGLTPTDIKSVIKQRVRWARGVIQSFNNLKVIRNKNLSFHQKLIFTSNYFYWWSFLRRMIFIASPILFALFDIKVVANDLTSLVIFWVPAYFSVNYYMGSYAGNIRTQRWGEVYETILAPYMVIPVLLESIGIRESKFKVTSKSVRQGNSFLVRIPHLILLVLIILAFIKYNYGKYGSELIYGSFINFWLLHHAINLFLSVAFFNDRPILRSSERFKRNFGARIFLNDNYAITANGYDISEGGLSIQMQHLQWFPKDIDIRFEIEADGVKADFKVKLLRSRMTSKNNYIYSFLITEIDDTNKMEYFQIIYDQRNSKLAEVRDIWLSEYDALSIGIRKLFRIHDLNQKDIPDESQYIDDSNYLFKDHVNVYLRDTKECDLDFLVDGVLQTGTNQGSIKTKKSEITIFKIGESILSTSMNVEVLS